MVTLLVAVHFLFARNVVGWRTRLSHDIVHLSRTCNEEPQSIVARIPEMRNILLKKVTVWSGDYRSVSWHAVPADRLAFRWGGAGRQFRLSQ